MKRYPKNLKEALTPILILNWLIGLGLIQYPVGNSKTKLNFIFIFIIAFSLWIAAVIFEIQCSNSEGNSFDEMVFTMLRYFNTLTATISTIVGWFYRKKMHLCVERIELMDQIFESLGMTKSYRKIFKKSLFLSIIWLILIFNVYIADVYLHLTEMELMHSAYCVFCFQWPIHINSVVDITFMSALSCIGLRFEKINCLLRENSIPSKNFVLNTTRKTNRISILSTPTNLVPLSIDLVELLRHLHLELCKITKEMNKIYGVQMTMEMTTNFVSITIILFYLRNVFRLPDSLIDIKIKHIMALTLWITIYLFRFLQVNITSGRICAEAHETKNVILNLELMQEDVQSAEKMEQFILQLTQDPLFITMYGLENLNLCFIGKVLGKAITYLVILLQLRPETNTSEDTTDE